MDKAKDLGIYDDFMMIATVGLVSGDQGGQERC
jgi:hypothetical protein